MTFLDLPPARNKPCAECPWRRKSLPGWLGPYAPEEWLALVHSDQPIACHTSIPDGVDEGEWDDLGMHQCAGSAIFRSNVFKKPRNPQVATLPSDHVKIFSNNKEFLEHHD